MRPTIAPTLLLLTLVTTQACRADAPTQEALQTAVVAALGTLVAELVAERPADAAAYTERLRAYLEAHPAFYGSAAALLDEAGTVTASPYVYRMDDGYATLDLAQPDYDIATQEWVTMPLAANAGIWTPPYFDAGGGEIWMITRSVPARDADGSIFAIITTDLPVDQPAGSPDV
jgi:sigma-B regulation protein RsbU (phosphoserine phosphatase)